MRKGEGKKGFRVGCEFWFLSFSFSPRSGKPHTLCDNSPVSCQCPECLLVPEASRTLWPSMLPASSSESISRSFFPIWNLQESLILNSEVFFLNFPTTTIPLFSPRVLLEKINKASEWKNVLSWAEKISQWLCWPEFPPPHFTSCLHLRPFCLLPGKAEPVIILPIPLGCGLLFPVCYHNVKN